MQFRAEGLLLPCLDTAYQVKLRTCWPQCQDAFFVLLSHNIWHSLFFSPMLNANITSQPSLYIQILIVFFFCCQFFLAFPNFKHINKKSIKMRNDSMMVLLQMNSLCCLVLPEVSKINLTSKCCSSYSFEGWSRIILRLNVDFGVGDDS